MLLDVGERSGDAKEFVGHELIPVDRLFGFQVYVGVGELLDAYLVRCGIDEERARLRKPEAMFNAIPPFGGRVRREIPIIKCTQILPY